MRDRGNKRETVSRGKERGGKGGDGEAEGGEKVGREVWSGRLGQERILPSFLLFLVLKNSIPTYCHKNIERQLLNCASST